MRIKISAFLAIAALLATLLAAPAAVTAQGIVSKTWFDEEKITGVAASSSFDVVLVNSNRTRAVVEMSEEFEPYLEIRRDAGGIVSVGRRQLSNREAREYNRIANTRKLTMRMTLYLPALNTIRLSSGSSLTTSDSFDGENLDIMTSGSSGITGSLRVTSRRVKVQTSSASMIENLVLEGAADLTVVSSGSSGATIHATELGYSKLGVSSAAVLRLTGSGQQANWSASGVSRLNAEKFTGRELTLTASSGARVEAGVAGGDATVTASGIAQVTLAAAGVETTRLITSSGAVITVFGNGGAGHWSASGNSQIDAERFMARELDITSSSGARVVAAMTGTGNGRANLSVTASGISHVNVAARGVEMSNLLTSSGAEVTLSGSGDRGDWSASGNSRVNAE